MAGPLENVNVVELGQWVAVPNACAILADWGANVIKIEASGNGDPERWVEMYEGVSPIDMGVNSLFEMQNRNKRSIALNLRDVNSKEILRRLIQKADVFAVNFRLEAMKRAGLDYDSLRQINPHLIYAILNGYGFRGKDKNKPGYDYSAFWARSGCMAKFAEAGGTPQPQRAGFGDAITGMLIAGGISAALFSRERTGKGQALFFNLYHTGLWALSSDTEIALYRGVEASNTRRDSVVNPLWNMYQANDGRWLQLVMVHADLYWSKFCKVMGLQHLERDARFDTAVKRQENNRELIKIIDDVFKTKNCLEWERIYDENELPCGRVQTITDVINDPQAWENSFFTEIEHPICGRMKYVTSPVEFSETPSAIKSSAPQLGQHTEEVLLELGYDWGEIAALRDQGAIG
jgi:crotonobetainyl-CoA:carnitine CoA-transferase CaiB-like acyl-CoA transferase